MNIRTEHGEKIKFLNEHGYTSDRQYANRFLRVGQVYTVDKVEVKAFSSEVILVEFPERRFNTVMFENVANESEVYGNDCPNGACE